MDIITSWIPTHNPIKVISGVTTLGVLLCLINMQQIETFVAQHTYRNVHSMDQESGANKERSLNNKSETKNDVRVTSPVLACPTLPPQVCPKRECTYIGAIEEGFYKVPNIVHYDWYYPQKVPMTFKHYLSILSVHKALKPEKIYIHMNISKPSGRYWDKILRLDNIEPLNEGMARELLGIKLIPDSHMYATDSSDIGRITNLLKYGGIYLNYDILVINSFDEIRKNYDFTLVQDKSVQISYGLLSNSIVMTSPDAAFLYLWANSYLEGFKPRQWSYNLIQKPSSLLKRFPRAVHLSKDNFHLPLWDNNNINEIWGNGTLSWRNLNAVQIPYRHIRNSRYYRQIYAGIEPDENNIVYMNNTFAEVAREILSLKKIKIRD